MFIGVFPVARKPGIRPQKIADQPPEAEPVRKTDTVVELHPPRVEGRCDACGGALRQREDDTEAVIAERLRVYQEQTSPLIERYQRRGVLLTVDGRGRPEEVTARIVAALPGQGG